MDLKSYLTQHSISDAAFAESVGASERAVIKWKRGERIPRSEAMARIRTVTDGAVTANDFFNGISSNAEASDAA